MSLLSPSIRKPSSSQISVAAESIVAAQFALSGFDVLEQPGRARPFYDLGVARSGRMLKVRVHASLNGFWDLADLYLDGALRERATAEDYHRAIGLWLERQSTKVMCCLVEFEPADLHRMPRIYLAEAVEVAAQLHEKFEQLACDEIGLAGLDVVHTIEGMPLAWRFSQSRIAEVMSQPPQDSPAANRVASATQSKESAATRADTCVHPVAVVH